MADNETCPRGWCALARVVHQEWYTLRGDAPVGCVGLEYPPGVDPAHPDGDRLTCITGDYDEPDVWCPVRALVWKPQERKRLLDLIRGQPASVQRNFHMEDLDAVIIAKLGGGRR